MRISLNLAQHYSNVDLLKSDQATLLEKIGAQLGAIDEVYDFGARFEGIVIAKVETLRKHQNADNLSVAWLDDGGVTQPAERNEQGLIQVVCGATNVAIGQLIAYIPPGVVVPNTVDHKGPYRLERREIRGVPSSGMIASPHELGLSDDQTGILVLTTDDIKQYNVQPGTPLKQLFGLDDTVIDIENKMFTHRPDAFGVLGIAREIAGIQELAFQSPAWYSEGTKPPTPAQPSLKLSINNQIPELVPRFVAAAVKDVTIKPSPYFMQASLSRVGIRPVNNIVDITNFMMMVTGQPVHAYDYDKVTAIGGAAKLAIRLSKPSEELSLLGDKIIKLDDQTIVITAGDKIIGLGGVMGGSTTQVDENTKRIIVEVGNFDMNATRHSARSYGLFTDAAVRFTKGQSRRQNMVVMTETLNQIQAIAGGSLASAVNDLNPHPVSPSTLSTSAEFINSRLGLELSADTMAKLLKNVEFEVSVNDHQISVKPPFWRTDIKIAEDLVEEVGRLYGYDRLPLSLPIRDLAPAALNHRLELKSRLRQILAMAGANEVLTYSFVDSSLLTKVGQDPNNAYHIRNAIRPELQFFRLSLTPSLLEKIRPNVKLGYEQFAIFEIGKAHHKPQTKDGNKTVPAGINTLALVVTNNKPQSGRSAGAAFYQAKAFLEFLAAKLDINIRYTQLSSEFPSPAAKPYDPQRSAQVSLANNGQELGVVGEFKTTILSGLKLPIQTAGFEINIDELLECTKSTRHYQPLPRFPKLQQDITLSVPASLSYGQVVDLVNQTLDRLKPPNSLMELEPIDIYQKAEAERKNITLRLTLNSYERTLTSKEANKILSALASAAKTGLGATVI